MLLASAGFILIGKSDQQSRRRDAFFWCFCNLHHVSQCSFFLLRLVRVIGSHRVIHGTGWTSREHWECCVVVLYDESVHEIKGHLALLVEVKRMRMLFTPSSSYGVGDETRHLSCC